MGIKKLLNDQKSYRGRSLRDRLPSKTYNAIESDLKEVVLDVEKGGAGLPMQALVDYIKSEYNVAISRSAVTSWYERLRK